jgi:hypothetical protein
MIDSGKVSIADLAAAWAPTRTMATRTLDKSINNAPQHHYVMQAAVRAMDTWLRTGRAPPSAARIEVLAEARKAVLDVNGNARGGVRSPWMDVPVARLSGSGNSGNPQAIMLGSVEPLPDATLMQLYPGGRSDYITRFTAALDEAIKRGFILVDDRAEIIALAGAAYPNDRRGS